MKLYFSPNTKNKLNLKGETVEYILVTVDAENHF